MNDKVVGVFIGLAIVIGASVLGGMAVAHTNEGGTVNSGIMSSGMMTHMMHHDGNHDDMGEHMENCPMMKGGEGHQGMHEMMMGRSHMSGDMDKDGDGLCDMCGMPIEECQNCNMI